MNQRKLVLLLESFSKYDLNRFKKYLRSPYYNENETLVGLFEILDEGLRKGQLDELGEAEIWRKLFGEKVGYDDVKFRRLYSDLTKLGEHFLGLKIYEENQATHYTYILQALGRGSGELNKHFIEIERKSSYFLEKRQIKRSTQYFLDNFFINYELHLFLEKNSARKSQKLNLQQADFYLDCFYFAQKIKNYCDALNYKNVLNVDIKINFAQELVELIKTTAYAEVPAIQIYLQVMLTLLEREEEAHFLKLKALLNEHGVIFPAKELRTLYIFAQNYCIKRINAGQLVFFQELFELYKTLLKTGVIFTKKGDLTLANYKNIVTVGLAVKEFQWVEQFITENAVRLPRIHQKNALAYNLAHLHFNKGSYEKVIELLREMEYKDVFDGLSGRWLLMKTYFELGEYAALEALIDSFAIFVRRSKVISDMNKQKYLNAIRFVYKIVRLGYDRKSYSELHQQLLDAKAIIDKKWLLEKLTKAK